MGEGNTPQFDPTEHPCHNVYIRAIPSTGISRSQLSAIAEMSDSVRRCLSNFEVQEVGSLPENRRSVRRFFRPTRSGKASVNLTIIREMQQNATPCNKSSKIPAPLSRIPFPISPRPLRSILLPPLPSWERAGVRVNTNPCEPVVGESWSLPRTRYGGEGVR